jgi:hypothetical protein
LAALDLSLLKSFQLRESRQLQFRAECFNVASHANFNLPVIDLASPSFGRIVESGPAMGCCNLASSSFFEEQPWEEPPRPLSANGSRRRVACLVERRTWLITESVGAASPFGDAGESEIQTMDDLSVKILSPVGVDQTGATAQPASPASPPAFQWEEWYAAVGGALGQT